MTERQPSPSSAGPIDENGYGKWLLVGLLWFAFFLNQADRQMFSVTLPLIQADFALTSAQVGLVATTFTLVFGLMVPFAGLAGDVFSRRKVVALSLLIFSAGTLLTGMASSYILLLLFRGVATGAGEAMYAPAANSLIGEQHVKTRARALSLHQTANYTGVVLGSLLVGWVAQTYGWRWSFVSFGVTGLIWCVVLYVFSARLVPAKLATPVVKKGHFGRLLAESASTVLRTPILLGQIIGFSGLIFVIVGYLTWMPSLLYERFDLSLADAGFFAVLYHHLLAFVGLAVSGWLTDKLIGRFPKIRLLVMSSAVALFAPFLWLAATADTLWLIYVGLAGFGFFRGIYDSNLFAAIFDAVQDRLRSTVTGLVVAVAYVTGALSPYVMGLLKENYGLEGGLKMLAAVSLVTGLAFLFIVIFNKVRGPEAVGSSQAGG